MGKWIGLCPPESRTPNPGGVYHLPPVTTKGQPQYYILLWNGHSLLYLFYLEMGPPAEICTCLCVHTGMPRIMAIQSLRRERARL